MKVLKRIKKTILYAAVGITVVLSGIPAGAETASTVDSSQTALSSKAQSSLSADFVMSRTISALKSELKSEGRLTLGGEGRLRWETLTPAHSLLVINHAKGWIHYPDLKVTKSFDLSTDPVMRVLSEQLSALTTGRFDAVENLYDISTPKDGRRTLIPKSPEIKKLFKEMQVAVNADGAVTEVLLVSTNGDTTSISFKDIIMNPKLSDSLFSEPKSR